ncbi:phosphatidate cytidylyltransferase [Aestuariirhabdus litorea]|uniref:Phosphatidate cytidylyltransferase n=1 Tax=Aestuariirhabdus litorea TaxID=2528527 RepID=A0A3P3VQU4_9GAMM|nr:phosphatidate cytidylyltransferase [Aestuariirhabdus litorea]RRJ85105.1 phosphatidate cytidylyltransferase [Aestuariirhabdus litorea]RWW98331.1 phosphatidate cytidylyltransferase [Endozoicomonadaceae bacterium GTF-13]
MLKQRVITALILAPIALCGVFFLPLHPFSLFIAGVILIGAWEWANLAGFSAQPARIGYSLSVALALFGATQISAQSILWSALGWWLLALGLVVSYPASAGLWRSSLVRLLIGYLVLVPAWVGLVLLKSHPDSWILIMFLLFLVWGADVGAYFAGKYLGRHKLAPKVSPKKTWEGVLGGIVTVVLVALVAQPYLPFKELGPLLGVTVFVALVSVLGDLAESMFKRERGIKDSSQLLPGHGGILDRIDSLTAAIPLFALALMVMAG